MKGNPTGIVLDGDALSEAQMQAIAKQAGFSECAFVCRSDKADLRLRFFMPLQETGLCGHATVASICALMEQDARWRGKSELLVETASGVLPIRYRAETNEVMMTQAPAQFAPFGGDREALMASIGLHAEDLDESLPLVYGSTGVWTLIVLVRDLAAFERMQPDNQRFPAVLTENPCASVHPITRETRHSEAQMHGRHFSSAFAGTAEDPVTGTASGVMGAYALRYLQPDAAAVDLVVEQGQEIGKDGIVGVHAAREGEIIAVQISGTAVKTKETMWNLED
ncbi:PhzF family phenazine biosynthesis isomerase [Ruminococcaceae bacterium TF06-43]|nr:PhzF family phenazine biosynthesis isomerase [Oscillospiraceae bacterium]RHU70721.1 PhzF family phenazine biosynthesis isomerase [Ruminococcaceae bacterium TF06-43]HCQ51666.1 isomerase [Oscillibacter sp.]